MSPHSPEGAAPDPFHAHDHAHCSETVLRRAEEQARAEGVRLTPVRRRVLEILLDSEAETQGAGLVALGLARDAVLEDRLRLIEGRELLAVLPD